VHRLLVLSLLTLVLSTAWSFAVPMFEAPDELAHWQYLRYVHDTGRLPVYSMALEEAAQPPLYYWLMAPFAKPVAMPRSLGWRQADGRWFVPPGVRRFLGSRSGFSDFRSARVVRALTVLISVGTIIFTYLVGREATGRETTGLLAAGLVLLLPQFTFRAMNISNDALMICLCALTAWFVVRIVRRGCTWLTVLAASACVGAAFLAKPNAIVWAPVLAAAIGTERIAWSRRLAYLCGLTLIVLIAAPWLVRNQILYGDPLLSSSTIQRVLPHLVEVKPLTGPYFRFYFPRMLAASFVGVFGWMNLAMPLRIYYGFALVALFATVGLLRHWRRLASDRRLLLILLIAPILALALVVNFNRTFTQPQGRYLFPALPALGVLAAIGFEAWPSWTQRATVLLLVALALLNVYVIVRVVIPAYV
jgi:4-amino-4-deoxy-L-arabinose transferase-like glycosyltransferase